MASGLRPDATAGGGVVVRDFRHQCARHPGAGARDRRPRPRATESQTADPAGAAGVPAVVHLRGGAARHVTPPCDWAADHADSVALPDLAYTLARRRGHRPVRTAVLAGNLTELTAPCARSPTATPRSRPPVGHDDRGPVWVFSGQGSQWAAMGADLLATEPVFAATVAEVEPLIAAESGFSVTEAMAAQETVTGIDRVQPTLFAMQVALAAAMASYGVRPGAVIGHSMGEVAAAVVAGAMSLEDGVRVICRRSRLMSRIAGAGAMASVELPAAQVRESWRPRCHRCRRVRRRVARSRPSSAAPPRRSATWSRIGSSAT